MSDSQPTVKEKLNIKKGSKNNPEEWNEEYHEPNTKNREGSFNITSKYIYYNKIDLYTLKIMVNYI